MERIAYHEISRRAQKAISACKLTKVSESNELQQRSIIVECSQIPCWTNEEIADRQCRGHGTESKQSSRIGFFHVRAMLGPIFPLKHLFRRLSRVPCTGARGGHVSVARLRVFDN